MTHYKNILRFDYGRTHGWWVRFERGGSPIRKLFSDRRYGGRRAALKHAKAFRDGAPIEPKVLPAQSRPGQGRVYLELRSYRDRSGTLQHYQAWSAWIRVDGRPRHTSYSIPKHGGPAAKRLAKQWLAARREEAAT